MEKRVVLSHIQAKTMIEAANLGRELVAVSTDLGRSQSSAVITEAGVTFPAGDELGWDDLQRIAESERKCFDIVEGRAKEVQEFSETTGLLRSLAPTAGAPTTLVSGIPMHRIKNMDPIEDTKRKIATVASIHGRVLDTATGLGYTAIQAARAAHEVVTVELDPTALEIARRNPWSRELFENPKITQVTGDVFEVVRELPDRHFSVVIHDPPTIQLAGDLYSGEFYRELHRVLSGRGKLFHYIGDPDSSLGHRTTLGVLRRLQEAGFAKVTRRPEAFGVLALKER